MIAEERRQLAVRTLAQLNPRAREVLIRFYLDEQPIEQICDEMALTSTQFRLLKSRAKAKFGAQGQRKLRFPRAA